MHCNLPGNRIRIAQHISTDDFSAGLVTSSKRTPDACSILDLPREIRDAVYDFLIPIHQDIPLNPLHLDFDTKTSHWHPDRSPRKEPNLLSLLCASKQTHHEVASRLFSANNFHVTCWILQDEHIAPAPTDLLSTFGFAGLLPLHPAYAQFLTSLTVFACGGWELNYGETLRIANPARHCRRRPDDSAPERSEDAIDRFITAADLAAQSMARCHCLRFIPLGNGIYTLRRPPGPDRERCKAATWQNVQRHHGRTIGEMQQGVFVVRRSKARCFSRWACCVLLCCLPCIPVIGCVVNVWESGAAKRWRGKVKGKRGRES